jgi:transforming growth factor-beta-induced protein
MNMNFIKKKYSSSILKGMMAALVLTVFNCSDDFESPALPAGNTVVDIVSANNDLDLMEAALKATGLEATLDNTNSGAFTVFAPSDAAFLTYLQGVYADAGLTEEGAIAKLQALTNSSPSLTISQLVTRLSYHFISSEIRSSQVTGPLAFTTINSARLSLSKKGSDLLINANAGSSGAKIIAVDADASNGIVHTIDKVVAPVSTASTLAFLGVTVNYNVTPATATVSAAASNYNVLANAIKRADIFTTLLPNSTPLPDYTIFAPTDDAFITFLGAADEAAAITAINAYDKAALAALLKYHIVPGRILSSDLTTGNRATLLADKSFAVDVTNNTIDEATLTGTNTLTNAGVLHTLNAVITP